MAAQSPLRRWKRFFPVFDTIDAAIVASQLDEEVGCAEVLREAMGEVVQILCDAPEEDPAEEFCRILDEVMVEYLITLKTVPVTPSVLASTDLAKAVAALQEHESEQIRGMACDIVGMWRASVESDLAKARARLEVLRKLSDETLTTPRRPSIVSRNVNAAAGEKKRQAKDVSSTAKTDSGVRSNLVEMATSNVPAKVSEQLPKKIAPVACPGRANAVNMMVPRKMPAIVGNGGRDHAGFDKTEDTKRKFRAEYQDAEDAKRQRKITVIEAAKTVKPPPQQLQRKVIEPRRQVAEDAKISAPLLKKSAPVVGIGRAHTATTDKMPAMDKMEATKRKLQAGYEEAADAKRQRKIMVIEAPEMVEQRRRKMHPILRQRSQQRGATSTAVRR